MEYNNNNLACNVSIKEIANWTENSKVTIPALQRGLVWSPSQIELLWDSLFRGIPIGSLVVCKRIEQQRIEELNNNDNEEYFHLLDGQQRVNAIQLGFDDFNNSKNPKKSILWLDLKPTILPNSTRNYLFRVTTTAHPWGYYPDDSANRLSAIVIRNGLEKYTRDPFNPEYIRPKPDEIHPFNSNYAVPLSILWEAYYQNNRQNFKDNIINILSNSYNKCYWIEQVLKNHEDWSTNIDYIYNGLTIAANTQIIVLKTPDNLLEETKQEQNNSKENEKDITAIEHLFQRLNRQGTELNGEELTYSMIKAYWPKIKTGIENIEKENKLMPASRLISLAIRTIVSETNTDKKISAPYNVTNIRKLAKDNTKECLRNDIINFINNDITDTSSLLSCCKEVDSILGVNNNKDWGLPPVLRSSIAYETPELYLLLILLTRQFIKENNKISENEEISKALQVSEKVVIDVINEVAENVKDW